MGIFFKNEVQNYSKGNVSVPLRGVGCFEADRMEIQGDKLMVYSRGRLVYVADLGQIMLAKLTPGREDGNGRRASRD